VKPQDTSAETKPDLPLEIAHILLIDVVGYSKLLVDEQIEFLDKLNQIAKHWNVFRQQKEWQTHSSRPETDGALFPAAGRAGRCALEISRT
jgi:hypothetical protein